MSEESWLPTPDEASAPFFEGAKEGRLMLQTCRGCSVWLYPVRGRCPECGGNDIGWEQASGRGTVYSHGLLRRAYHPRHAERLPLPLAVIDLEEGVRINSNLVDVDPDAIEAGMPVEVTFETFADGAAVPVFRPAGEPQS